MCVHVYIYTVYIYNFVFVKSYWFKNEAVNCDHLKQLLEHILPCVFTV